MNESPRIAIVDPNTLAVLGLTNILQSAMPIIEVDAYGSFAELEANEPNKYIHFFVELSIALAHRDFFIAHRHKTIILSQSPEPYVMSATFHNICVNVPEKQLLRNILMLEKHAHAHGKNLPPMSKMQNDVLSAREIEVLALIVKGSINKEIADQLNIGTTTVVTHRKNIMNKLGLHSVSALTIYAVMHGYVDINSI